MTLVLSCISDSLIFSLSVNGLVMPNNLLKKSALRLSDEQWDRNFQKSILFHNCCQKIWCKVPRTWFIFSAVHNVCFFSVFKTILNFVFLFLLHSVLNWCCKVLPLKSFKLKAGVIQFRRRINSFLYISESESGEISHACFKTW